MTALSHNDFYFQGRDVAVASNFGVKVSVKF